MPPVTLSDLPVILPAAGFSSRMRGVDKLLLDVDGIPLLRRQTDRASAATRGRVYVTLPEPPHARYDALTGSAAEVVAVPDASTGLSAGLRRAFGQLPARCSAAMVLLPDLPDITTCDIRTVLSAVTTHPDNLVWCGATPEGKPGHPVVIAASLFPMIAQLRGDAGARDLRSQARAEGKLCTVLLAGQRALLDLDTPEAWENWRAERQMR